MFMYFTIRDIVIKIFKNIINIKFAKILLQLKINNLSKFLGHIGSCYVRNRILIIGDRNNLKKYRGTKCATCVNLKFFGFRIPGM